MSQIILNEHQILPIVKLTENRSDQHGLLLWYMMGTGKTLIALSYLLNLPKMTVNIICPEDLFFVWEHELKKIPQINNKINFYSYEQSDKFLKRKSYKGEILIIDEAQHLVPIIKLKNIDSNIKLLNSSYRTLILTGTPIYNDFTDLIYLVNISAGKTMIPYNYTKFRDEYYKVNRFKSILFGYTFPIVIKINKVMSNLLLFGLTIPEFILAYNEKSELLQKFNNIKIIKKIKNSPDFTVFAIGLPLIASLFEFIYNTMSYKIEDYKEFNIDKLVNNIKPYISYYQNKENINNYFPDVIRHSKVIEYNQYQLGKWLELTQGVMNIETVKDLNISNAKDFEYFTNKIDLKTYLDNGIIIGNLKNNDNEYSPKFNKILETCLGKRAVFYSNFTNNGILLFKEFLDYKKVKYLYLDISINNNQKTQILERFKNENILLLLHPKYTEGVSILGAEQLHILEPINSLAKKEQVIARVVRYLSHQHLPIKERRVDIFEWASGSLNIINKQLMSIKKWAKHNPEVSYLLNFNIFNQDLSPDQIIIQKINKISDNEKKITKLLEENSKGKKIDCCIKFPSRSQEKECMKALNRYCIN